MSRGFRICMAKWSRGCLRPTYNQPKLTLSSRFVATQLWCCKSKTLRQFSSERSAIIQTWTPKWWLQVQLIADLSDENWRSVFDLQHLLFFVTRPIFSYDLTSSRYNFETKVWSLKPTIFSESWVHTVSVVTGPKKLSRWKLSGTECITKKNTFSPISVHRHTKNVADSCALNFDATDFPHS